MNLVLVVLFLFISQCQSFADEIVVRLHASGIDNTNSIEKFDIVESLLGDPILSLETHAGRSTAKLYKNADGGSEASPPLFLVTSGEHDIENVSSADISLLFLSGSTLFDETVVINRMQDCFATLKLGDDKAATEKKRPLMILFSGSASAAGRIEILLNEAWALFDFSARGDYSTATILSEMDIRILLVPSGKGEVAGFDAKTALKTVISYCMETASVADAKLFGTFDAEPSMDNAVPESAVPTARSKGIETSATASELAYAWALKAANASVERLNKRGLALEFRGYMKNLVNGAIAVYDQNIDAIDPVKDEVPSAAIVKLAKKDLLEKIYSKMLPFLSRQIQLARNEIAQNFNTKIADIVVSINIMTDLRAARTSSVREFDQTISDLIPPNSPWQTKGGQFEVQEFKATLDDYLDGREDHYKLLGVLSRGRKPIDISFHTMLYHPLGRDYRQEPLGVASMRDMPFFEDDSDRSRKIEEMAQKGTNGRVNALPAVPEQSTVSALAARQMLQRHIQQAPVVMGDAKRKSEFAREMLMFPLSVKNPGVPMQSGGGGRRRRRKSANDSPVPTKDSSRDKTGPERFIRYDLEPMNEVKIAMDNLLKKEVADNKKTTSLEKAKMALNRVPLMGFKYTQMPPINYQKASAK
jgi:hypothetical protein